jgi:hypothetical protein
MTVFRLTGVIALSVLILQAEDRQFSLSAFGVGPITLHTTLTHEGDGERLIATAKNESGTAIQRAKMCVRAFESESVCLFELSNTELWTPGGELNWNLTTAKKVAVLSHYATFEKLDVAQTSESATTSLRPAPISPSTTSTSIIIPAAPSGSPRLGADRHLYISPMEGKLDGFIAAEVIKEHLPVNIVLDDKDADLVLVGQSLKEDDHWYNAVWGGKDKNEGNMRLIDVRSRSMVWAGEAGDRSLIYGQFKRGGERKVAERLVRQMKKDYFRAAQ